MSAARPSVVVSNRQPRELVDECWRVLLGSPIDARVFRFGTALVRVPDADGLDTLDPVKLTGLLHRAADWFREDEHGTRPGRVPPDVARDMVALPDPAVLRLVGVTPLPILRSDGSVLANEGHDPDSGLFCRPGAPLRGLAVEATRLARVKALALLRDELLGVFRSPGPPTPRTRSPCSWRRSSGT